MSSTRRRVALSACILVGATVGLAGCSSGGTPKGTKKLSPGATVPFNLAHNARAGVSTTGCDQKDGAWVLTGTVKNATHNSTAYQIVVDFVTQPGGTVLSTSVVNVPTVGSGQTASWSATGAQGHIHVACIVRQAQTS